VVNLGARIAGGIMVANGLALLVETGLTATLRESAPAASFRPSPVGMVLDLLIGGWLLTGNPKVLPWAKVRVVLGALIFPAVLFTSGQTFLAGLQVAYSAGLALLLFGDPRALRIGAGVLATGFGLALETIGLFGMATGTAPLASVMMAPGLESGGPVASVDGTSCPYRLTAASGHWYLRKAEAARKENPLADRWIVWPEKDAHVLVIAEQVEPGLSVDMDRFAEVVLGNVRQASKDLKVLARDPLPGGGTRLHTQATINGLAVESYYGLYAREPWIFQIVAFASRAHFASVQGDLEAIVASFEGPAP
jgi:hypothetical protein